MATRPTDPSSVINSSPSPSSSENQQAMPPSNTPSQVRKRPLPQPSQDPPQHPQKRERFDTPTPTKHVAKATPDEPTADASPLLHECGLKAWDTLKSREEGRTEFRKKDIIQCAVEVWEESGFGVQMLARLKKEMGSLFRKGTMFKKSTRPDAPVDAFVMADPNYVGKAAKGKEVGKKGEGRKGDLGSAGEADDEVVLVDGVVNKARVPEEWKAEAFKPVCLSSFDKSDPISFVGDQKENVVKGFKGYRMIRATSGVSEGDWYFECEILPFEPGNANVGWNIRSSHVRLGWSLRRSHVETPVGYDNYGFGYRDLTGEFVHGARPKKYGESFGVGDVIGCRIVLPELTQEQKAQIAYAEEQWLIHRFVANANGTPPDDSGIDLSPNGWVEFYKNGKSMGVPVYFTEPQPPVEGNKQEDSNQANGNAHDMGGGKDEQKVDSKKCMIGGVYYPSVALFNNAVVKANFGPDFKFPLLQGPRPMSDAAREAPPPPVAEVDKLDIVKKTTNKEDGQVDKGGDGENDRASFIQGSSNDRAALSAGPGNEKNDGSRDIVGLQLEKSNEHVSASTYEQDDGASVKVCPEDKSSGAP